MSDASAEAEAFERGFQAGVRRVADLLFMRSEDGVVLDQDLARLSLLARARWPACEVTTDNGGLVVRTRDVKAHEWGEPEYTEHVRCESFDIYMLRGLEALLSVVQIGAEPSYAQHAPKEPA